MVYFNMAAILRLNSFQKLVIISLHEFTVSITYRVLFVFGRYISANKEKLRISAKHTYTYKYVRFAFNQMIAQFALTTTHRANYTHAEHEIFTAGHSQAQSLIFFHMHRFIWDIILKFFNYYSSLLEKRTSNFFILISLSCLMHILWYFVSISPNSDLYKKMSFHLHSKYFP